ncbi:hypothetical protein FRX31_017249, partial [Thalictrum thalictroides]
MSNAPVIWNIPPRLFREMLTCISGVEIRQFLELLESPSLYQTLQPEDRERYQTIQPEKREQLRACLLEMEEQTETLLGPRVLVLESKGTCSICLDDMKVGDE